jgi:hypothetical protein
MTERNFVTVEYCKQATQMKKWLLSVLLALMSLFIVVAGWGIVSAERSVSASTLITSEFEAHKAVGVESEKHMTEAISELKSDIKELGKKIDRLMERIPK